MNKIILVFISFCVTTVAYSENNEEMQKAILRDDAAKVIELGNLNEANEIEALDALATQFTVSSYNYEELIELLAKAQRPMLRNYIQLIVWEHEKKLRKKIVSMTPEQILEYRKTHPKHSTLVNSHVSNIINGSIDSLSYLEMAYLDRMQFEYGNEILKNSLKVRDNERKAIYRDNAKIYANNERITLPGLKYLLEQAAWEYFIQAHKKLTTAYAQIPMVNDESYMAAYQYQQMVKACFSPKLLADILQKIVNDYATQINKSRKEYANMAGLDKYKAFSYKIPQITLHTEVNYSCLDQIYISRHSYSENLNTSSTVSGVATWLFGPLAGLIAKGIGDYMSIDSLVEDEYDARKKYVDLVHDALRKDFQNYLSSLTKSLEQSFNNNITEYEKSFKK